MPAPRTLEWIGDLDGFLRFGDGWHHAPPDEDETMPDPPPPFPKPLDELFPWSEPIVFSSGRYAVHRVSKPIRKLWAQASSASESEQNRHSSQ